MEETGMDECALGIEHIIAVYANQHSFDNVKFYLESSGQDVFARAQHEQCVFLLGKLPEMLSMLLRAYWGRFAERIKIDWLQVQVATVATQVNKNKFLNVLDMDVDRMAAGDWSRLMSEIDVALQGEIYVLRFGLLCPYWGDEDLVMGSDGYGRQ
jgi:hypothetical protein